jgi:uncharacterized spore protein YtfJ
MHRLRIALLYGLSFGALVGAMAPHATAQPPLGLEFRGGFTMPVGAFAGRENGLDARAGTSAELSTFFVLVPGVALYFGYGQASFGCGRDCQLYGSGVGAGVRVAGPEILPFDARPWLRSGPVLRRMDVQLQDDGVPRRTGDRGFGWDWGGGAEVRPLSFLRLTPGLQYRWYRIDLDEGALGGRAGANTVRYLSFDLGAQLVF